MQGVARAASVSRNANEETQRSYGSSACSVAVSSEGTRYQTLREVTCTQGRDFNRRTKGSGFRARCHAPQRWLSRWPMQAHPRRRLQGHVSLIWQAALLQGPHQSGMPMHARKEGQLQGSIAFHGGADVSSQAALSGACLCGVRHFSVPLHTPKLQGNLLLMRKLTYSAGQFTARTEHLQASICS